MNARQLWEKCKANWAVKIFCFVVAVLIYFFYRNISLTTRTLVVPLGVSSDGNMLPAGYHQPQVRVSIRGEPSAVSQITDNDVSVSLNIDFHTEPGRYDIPVQLELSPAVAVMEPLEVNVTPAVVPLDIAARVNAQVPLEVEIQGSPADGFQVTHTQVLPSTVGVTGAEPLVRTLGPLPTSAVSVDGKSASFSQEVEIIKENRLVTIQDATDVTVAVVIEPVQSTREFAGQSVYLYGLNPEFTASPEPSGITFSLSGPRLSLERYKPELYTVRADCTGITAPGEYDLPVTVTVPSGMRLSSQSARTVTVTVTEAESDTAADAVPADSDGAEEQPPVTSRED